MVSLKKRSRRYPAETMIDEDYTDDLALLVNKPAKVESILQVAGGISLYANSNKIVHAF